MTTIQLLTKQNKDLRARIEIYKDKLYQKDIEHKEEVKILNSRIIELENENKKQAKNYEKRIKSLESVVKDLIETVDKLTNKIEVLENENNELRKENLRLKIENEKLRNDNDRMKRTLNLNSFNSSIPSSALIKGNNKPSKIKITNNREKTNKKIGGQKGHKGTTLTKEEVIKKIKSKEFEHEVINIGETKGNYVSKYILDVKTIIVAKEYRIYIDNAQIPSELKSDVQYGENIKTICTILNTEGIVAINRLTDFVNSLTNGKLNIFNGSIVNFLKSLSLKCEDEIENIKNNILNSKLLFTEATTISCDNKNMFVINYTANNNTYFHVTEKKNKHSIDESNMLTNYTGDLVHDHETVMYNYADRNIECNVHVIRYLKGNYENTNNNWCMKLRNLFICLNEHKKKILAIGINSFTDKQLKKYFDRYDEILEEGYIQNEKTSSKYYQSKEKALLNRLKKYKQNHLFYISDFCLPFDNNLSERQLRHIKVKQKISGCFKKIENSQIFLNSKSIITTFKDNCRDFFEFFKDKYKINLATN